MEYYKYIKYKTKYKKLKTKKNLLGGDVSDKIIIDDYTFELLGKNTDSSRNIVFIKSTHKNGEETIFSAYQSNSEMGTWRLKYIIYHWNGARIYEKPGDYVTGTFIHLSLQSFIFDNFKNLNDFIGEYEQDEKIKKFINTRKQELDSCIKSDSNSSFNKLNSFSKEIYAQCGYFNRYQSPNILIDLPKIKKKINEFVDVNNIDINKLFKFKFDSEKLIDFYIQIVSIIKEFIILNFKVSSKIIKVYNYTFIYEQLEINVEVFNLIITDNSDKKNYSYSYIEYTFNNCTENFKDFCNKKYYFPYFIIPQDSKVNCFGVYDCFMNSYIYFCKPIEYKIQCYLEDECEKRSMGDNYYFIGDFLSEYTVFIQVVSSRPTSLAEPSIYIRPNTSPVRKIPQVVSSIPTGLQSIYIRSNTSPVRTISQVVSSKPTGQQSIHTGLPTYVPPAMPYQRASTSVPPAKTSQRVITSPKPSTGQRVEYTSTGQATRLEKSPQRFIVPPGPSTYVPPAMPYQRATTSESPAKTPPRVITSPKPSTGQATILEKSPQRFIAPSGPPTYVPPAMPYQRATTSVSPAKTPPRVITSPRPSTGQRVEYTSTGQATRLDKSPQRFIVPSGPPTYVPPAMPYQRATTSESPAKIPPRVITSPRPSTGQRVEYTSTGQATRLDKSPKQQVVSSRPISLSDPSRTAISPVRQFITQVGISTPRTSADSTLRAATSPVIQSTTSHIRTHISPIRTYTG